MMIVVDANLVVFFAVDGPLQEMVTRHFDKWHSSQTQLLAPAVLVSEATSAITKLVHFGHLSLPDAREALAIIHKLPIELVTATPQLSLAAFEWTHKLNRIAAYDSFYLALAEQYSCTLWTRDKKLANAANKPWVKYLEDIL